MNTQELIIRGIKIIDIAYLTVIFITLAIICSIALDKLFGPFIKSQADQKSTFRLILEIYLDVSLIAIVAYIIKNIVEIIPFPLDGIHGFDHKRVKELGGGTVFGFALFYYQYGLRDKIGYVLDDRFGISK